MLKRVLSLMLMAALLNVVGLTALRAAPQDDKEAAIVAKMRENIQKLGIGPKANVELKLHDGTRRKGYIIEAHDNHFMVVDRKTNAISTINYRDIKQIKGKNELTATKIGLTVVKGVAVVAAVAGISTLLLYFIARGTR